MYSANVKFLRTSGAPIVVSSVSIISGSLSYDEFREESIDRIPVASIGAVAMTCEAFSTE